MDICFGFDTGMYVATEAIDRLHTTASSHHRVIIVDIMGHKAGWLALGSGVAGGADVILIPEIPYNLEIVGKSLQHRVELGKTFSIVAVAEGAVDQAELDTIEQVKRDYGEQLCLMGNLDLDHLMTFGTPEQIAAEVRRLCETIGHGGGFILSTCNILIDAIPPENALAMYRAAEK